MKKYERYQDYVIKDGQLVGAFNEMYRDYEDPLEQTYREEGSLEKMIVLELMSQYGHKRALEFGCGFGHYTSKIHTVIDCECGVDVSDIAIKKARLRHPKPSFFVADLLDISVIKNFNPDCICLIEITWYVLDKLDEFKKLISLTSKNAGFFHTLKTYGTGQQKYGLDYFTNLDEIMKYWSDSVDILNWGQVNDLASGEGYRTFFYGKIK